MKRSIILFSLATFLFTASAFLAPVDVLAQSVLPSAGSGAQGGFVPCSGSDCQFCHFVQLGDNILGWLFTVVFLLFGVLVFVAGFQLLTSGGNQSALDGAKKKLSNALIGIIIVFCAWLVIDTLLKATLGGDNVVVDQNYGPWYSIQCVDNAQRNPNQINIVTPTPGAVPIVDTNGNTTGWQSCVNNGDGTETCTVFTNTQPSGSGATCTSNITNRWTGFALVCTLTRPVTNGGATSGSATGCSACADIPAGLPTKGAQACEISLSPTGQCQLPPTLANRLLAMHQQAGVGGARISEAWPPTGWTSADPTGIHSNPCHANGTCVDYGRDSSNPLTAPEINAIILAAQAQGLRPIYEVQTTGQRDALVANGVSVTNIQVVPTINAPHFSIYSS